MPGSVPSRQTGFPGRKAFKETDILIRQIFIAVLHGAYRRVPVFPYAVFIILSVEPVILLISPQEKAGILFFQGI